MERIGHGEGRVTLIYHYAITPGNSHTLATRQGSVQEFLDTMIVSVSNINIVTVFTVDE